MERLRKLTPPPPKPKDMKWKAKEYFIMGLTAQEVEKLTGINKRTLERYSQTENWSDERKAAKEKERQKIIAEYLKNQVSNEPKPDKPKTKKQIEQERKDKQAEIQKKIEKNMGIAKNMEKVRKKNEKQTKG